MSQGSSGLGNTHRRWLGNGMAWVALTLLGVFWMVPFLWMVSTSFKGIDEVYAFPPRFFPELLRWSNYVEAWQAIPFSRFFFNSLFVAGATTIAVVLTSSMAGYSFARLRYPGRDLLFLAYLGTIMIPFPVLIIPLFFLMRQFMLSIPREIEEAARMDGASFWRIYLQIIMPLSRPVVATLGIFTFLGSWNDFLWPLIMISSVENKTLPLGLTMFQAQVPIKTPWQLVMAAATFSVIPVLIVFVLGQKYYVRGIATTGLKG